MPVWLYTVWCCGEHRAFSLNMHSYTLDTNCSTRFLCESCFIFFKNIFENVIRSRELTTLTNMSRLRLGDCKCKWCKAERLAAL